MPGQLFEGTLNGLIGLLIAGVAYGCYAFGIGLVEGGVIERTSYQERKPGMPKWKATIWALSVATVLGFLASRDYTEYDGSGDGVSDPGEVVEVHTNYAPWFSFAKVFTFVAISTCFGVYKSHLSSDSET